MVEILITYDIEKTKDTTHYNKVKSTLFKVLSTYGTIKELSPESSLKLIRNKPLNDILIQTIKIAIKAIEIHEKVTIKYAFK